MGIFEKQGTKCIIAVGGFTVQARGVPQEIGDGLREMTMGISRQKSPLFRYDRTA